MPFIIYKCLDREVLNRKPTEKSVNKFRTYRKDGFDMKRPVFNETMKMPMNIQFFAAEGEGSEAQGGGEPDVDSLLERIAELETASKQKDADYQKLKNANDKATAQASELKKQLTARMSAQEQEDQAKAEAAAEHERKFNAMAKELATIKAKNGYLVLEMSEDVAQMAAEAEVEGDFEALHKIFSDHIKAIKQTSYEKFLADRGEVASSHDKDEDDPAIALAKSRMKNKKSTNKVNEDILSRYTR